jgi:hypothetical protein
MVRGLFSRQYARVAREKSLMKLQGILTRYGFFIASGKGDIPFRQMG